MRGPAAGVAAEPSRERRATRLYRGLLEGALRVPLLVILGAVAVTGASYWVFTGLPQELTPTEDRGVIFSSLTTPQGSTVAYTNARTAEVASLAVPLREDGDEEAIYAVVGSGGRANRDTEK